MNRRSIALALAPLLLAALPAGAYESQCRDTGDTRKVEESACLSPDTPECESGLMAARGRQLGEHTWLAQQGMQRAGLAPFIHDDDLLTYFVDGHQVGGTTNPRKLLSVEPAAPGAMTRQIQRRITIPELAQLVDWSYGVGDWMLGNEHCPAAGAPRGDVAAVQQCHFFRAEMGAVNSTHFLPLARTVYGLYHRLALDTARGCKQMAGVLTPPPPASATAVKRSLAQCEKEALAFEGVAAHFLGDAWSSGHMWQRWGSPVHQQGDARILQQAVALTSGFIHGWRAVAPQRTSSIASVRALQHDQLCMPGPFTSAAGEPIVEWRTTGSDARFPGGGDDYLFPCTATGPNDWSVTGKPELAEQRERMFTCLALGFREVYEAGPRSGDLAVAGPLAPGIKSSTDDACWNQRATNRSMALGYGIHTRRVFDSPALVTRIIPKVLPELASVTSGRGSYLNPFAYKREERRYRVAMGVNAFEMARLAHADPHGTAAADLEGPNLQDFMGSKRNSEYASLVTSGKVAYLETPDKATWGVDPPRKCFTDPECPDGFYCEWRGEAAERFCVSYSSAVLRGFREAELAAFCTRDGVKELEAGRPCTGEACAGCRQVVRPHLAAACDAASYTQAKAASGGSAERQAVCDVLQEKGVVPPDPKVVIAYQPFDPTLADAADGAADKLCALAPEKAPLARKLVEASPRYDVDLAVPAAVDIDTAGALEDERYTCGAAVGVRIWHLRHKATGAAHKHRFQARVQGVAFDDGSELPASTDDLDLSLFEGPECTRPLGRATAGDSQTLLLEWSVAAETAADVCVKARAPNVTSWAHYRFSHECEEPCEAEPDAGPGPPDARVLSGRQWVLESVKVVPEKPWEGWSAYTAESTSAHFDVYQGDKGDLQWTRPPERFDESGFSVTISVQSHPAPKALVMSSVIGAYGTGFEYNSQEDSIAWANSKAGESSSGTKTVTFKPTPYAGDIQVKIGMMWKVEFHYNYRLVK